MSRSNFQRSQSRVWYGDSALENPFYGRAGGMNNGYFYHHNQIHSGRQPPAFRPTRLARFPEMDEEEELGLQSTPEKQININLSSSNGSSSSNTLWSVTTRQGSPASHKSQDSGFSDTEGSPNMPSINSNSSSASKNCNENLSSPDKLTPKRTINEQLFQRSPSTSSEAPTPPTVIRRPLLPSEERVRAELSPRRISYSESNSPTPSVDLISKIDSLNFNNTSPLDASQLNTRLDSTEIEDISGPSSLPISYQCALRNSASSLKRGRVLTKCSRVKRNLNQQLQDSDEEMISLDSSELTNILNQTLAQDVSLSVLQTPKSILKSPATYNNETVVLSYVPQEVNNNTNQSSNRKELPTRERELPTYAELYPNGTSTPIMYPPKFYRSLPPTPTRTLRSPVKVRPMKLIDNFYEEPDQNPTNRISNGSELNFTQYDNPLLNGHTPAVQSWLDGLRFSCQNEVMSILQTKSISAAVSRNLKMTSATAVKLTRHLQSKVAVLQGEFEKVEKLFASIKRYQQQQEDDDDDDEDEKEIYQKAAPLVQSLATNIYEFVQKQKSIDYFGKDPNERTDRKKFLENSQSLVDMTTDLRVAAANGDDFDYRSVEEEVQIVKRYFLITIRLIFKNLIKVIIDSIEDSKCDLMLRSNLTYVASLSNLDYQGLASLNDAFISNGTVRALLIVCMDCKFSSIRALALRALATVCSTTETIRQLEKADGVEVLRDILADQRSNERGDPELREAVSVLTQITAPWHGEEHRIDGLRQHVHAIVEAVTEIVERTTCCQTLLLCSACLNNLTRIEATAVYSLMSHETPGKLKVAAEKRGPGASVFLFEQITSMLYNMSSNRKSHHHLAARPLVLFLTTIFNQKFYDRSDSRVESEAQRKTVKNILHILSRLIGSAAIGGHDDLLEGTVLPIFARVERSLDSRSEYFRDVSCLNRRLNESLGQRPAGAGTPPGPGGSTIVSINPVSAITGRATNPYITRLTIERQPNGGIVMLDKNRQESYV
ncbi:uncharacterized protein LOC131428254 isoform X2 [Malaya genurostris]|nr:uncharacterized protein LOC131428254 isoform X2 [Malaya genurostris]XP_058448028.1 uncharacterized protein LOC131428254 isoform X2 [Malaya genurostris]XP_058448029.1 uncharacterized protein LOC131428254 isoform X2 [Malaya genurostris]